MIRVYDIGGMFIGCLRTAGVLQWSTEYDQSARPSVHIFVQPYAFEPRSDSINGVTERNINWINRLQSAGEFHRTQSDSVGLAIRTWMQ